MWQSRYNRSRHKDVQNVPMQQLSVGCAYSL